MLRHSEKQSEAVRISKSGSPGQGRALHPELYYFTRFLLLLSSIVGISLINFLFGHFIRDELHLPVIFPMYFFTIDPRCRPRQHRCPFFHFHTEVLSPSASDVEYDSQPPFAGWLRRRHWRPGELHPQKESLQSMQERIVMQAVYSCACLHHDRNVSHLHYAAYPVKILPCLKQNSDRRHRG